MCICEFIFIHSQTYIYTHIYTLFYTYIYVYLEVYKLYYYNAFILNIQLYLLFTYKDKQMFDTS